MLYKEPNALQIRVTLSEIKPAVWRELVVPWTWHLGQLHLAIQAAFNWWNYHLHIGGLRYGDPELLGDGGFPDSPSAFDEREVRLLDFDRDGSVRFSYVYDFGDSLCVRQVAACIGSEPLRARTSGSGTIRSEVQRARGRAVIAAGEFAGGSDLTGGWDRRWDAGALAG